MRWYMKGFARIALLAVGAGTARADAGAAAP